jgi:hypothetical protein
LRFLLLPCKYSEKNEREMQKREKNKGAIAAMPQLPLYSKLRKSNL